MGDIVNKESDIYKQKKDFVDTLIIAKIHAKSLNDNLYKYTLIQKVLDY